MILDELPSGSQATAVRVIDEEDVIRVLKMYHRDVRMDEGTAHALPQIAKTHVVDIVETGIDPGGARWELQEWCEHGSLRDLLQTGQDLDLPQVVRQISEALVHIHGVKIPGDEGRTLLHLDVKPENVLVRSLHPLVLVLGDFGSARSIIGSRHLSVGTAGTPAYAPASGEGKSPKWDWWSLGMIAAEIASGRHPFFVEEGWLSEAAIVDLLAQGAIDLSHLPERSQLLCRGLLTRRVDERWGAAQITAWLSGDSPPVNDSAPAAMLTHHNLQSGAPPAAGSVAQLRFDGIDYDSPVELALAMQQNWDMAQELVMQRTDGGAFNQEVVRFLARHQITGIQAILDKPGNPFSRFIELLARMNPELPPIYRGIDVRTAAILDRLTGPDDMAIASEVARIEDPRTGYLAIGVLDHWSKLPGMTEPQLATRFAQAQDLFTHQSAAMSRIAANVATRVRAVVYASAFGRAYHLGKAYQYDMSRYRRFETLDWWLPLRKEESPFLKCLIEQLSPLAENELEEQKLAVLAAEREARRGPLVSWLETSSALIYRAAFLNAGYLMVGILLYQQQSIGWWPEGNTPQVIRTLSWLLIGAPIIGVIAGVVANIAGKEGSMMTARTRALLIAFAQFIAVPATIFTMFFTWVRMSGGSGGANALGMVAFFPAMASILGLVLIPWSIGCLLAALVGRVTPKIPDPPRGSEP